LARPQRLGLSAVRSEGAILPPSILQRIHREDPSLGGMTPDDFGLSGLRVREAASQAWNSLQAPWRAFQVERERLSATAPTTGVTRNRWLNQIAKALDYGAIDPLSDSLKLEGREFPVSHLYGHSPIHWVGFRIDLDHRTPGEKGAARMSPHGLVQLLLNASDDYLWGFVSNGLKWRILRDDNSLSRQSMVEFDLEAIFEGQLYDEFLLFYLLCHQTRVKAEKPEECWLERWSQAAANEGKRALDTLRNGVEKAIETLGQGFLRHPANQALRQSLRDGTLDKQTYYRQLLRMVYRLLFLFVAEDRNLLLLPEASLETRDLYAEYYSTQRLRLLAERLRGSHRHHDLFQQLRLILGKLGLEDGCGELGLPALGGFLFSAETCPDLDGAELSNGDFLQALRFLAVTQEGGRRTRVDYKNLASEEMGSVYESLLELHPELSTDGTKFELRSASGNERKTTGSYYTPDSLIQCLLDTALNPVVDEAIRTARQKFQAKDEEVPEAQAILALRVIDPAVGSGHFLIAAAHRIAKRLAQVRTGDDEPAPEATRRALRDVIGRCLYGIDVNPMSAELCKVALWMEALEPGKPLSFLDHHIVVGNSLIGATPKLIAAGIPDDAYTQIEGDDKAVCTALKRQNRAEQAGQGNLFSPEVYSGRGLLAAWERLEGLSDENFKSIQKKAQEFREAKVAVGMRQRLADTWCAAFTVPKVPASASGRCGITTATLRSLAAGKELDAPTSRAVEDSAARFGFLHPHLAFPDVFARGGFDAVLGNPPWERIKLQEKEFFAERVREVALAQNKTERTRLISSLRGTPLHAEFIQAKRDAEASSLFIRKSKRFPLAGRGDVNTYAVFAELMRGLVASKGRAGIIVPSGIATDDTTKHFFADLIENNSLSSLYDFENGMRESDEAAEQVDEDAETPSTQRRSRARGNAEDRLLFPGVHASFKFSLVTMTGRDAEAVRPQFAFFCHRPSDVSAPGRAFTLTKSDIALLNPVTKTCPIFRSARDAELSKGLWRGNQALGSLVSGRGVPAFPIRRVLDMGNRAITANAKPIEPSDEYLEPYSLRLDCDGGFLPIWEGKMIGAFNHRVCSVYVNPDNASRQAQSRRHTVAEWEAPLFRPRAAFAYPELQLRTAHDNARRDWLLAFKDVGSVTNERTLIAAAVPYCGTNFSLRVVTVPSDNPLWALILVGLLNSFALDYCLRQKLGGLHVSDYITYQLPVPPIFDEGQASSDRTRFIVSRVLELTYNSFDLTTLARGCGYEGEPFSWSDERRFWLRAELDAVFFHLYGLARSDVDYILETFPIVKRKDLIANGRYRTKGAILEVYDAMAEAIRTGVPYQTKLNPPPANGWTPPPLPPLEELLPKSRAANAAVVSANGTGACSPSVPPAARATLPSEPEEFILTSPSAKPLRDKAGQEMRVRVYGASEEVLLNRGFAVGKRKSGEAILWSVLADGETVPRDFKSPPCVVKRLKPKGS